MQKWDLADTQRSFFDTDICIAGKKIFLPAIGRISNGYPLIVHASYSPRFSSINSPHLSCEQTYPKNIYNKAFRLATTEEAIILLERLRILASSHSDFDLLFGGARWENSPPIRSEENYFFLKVIDGRFYYEIFPIDQLNHQSLSKICISID
ncbi:hypothetical protein [Comamonas aquatica]|uniref:hypothetical protein n=1 Tax=Comamonas aquatica TaxID=225991 RepID=UPI001EF25823|nr:hypothetical protein [Comamonas aquatica]